MAQANELRSQRTNLSFKEDDVAELQVRRIVVVFSLSDDAATAEETDEEHQNHHRGHRHRRLPKNAQSVQPTQFSQRHQPTHSQFLVHV